MTVDVSNLMILKGGVEGKLRGENQNFNQEAFHAIFDRFFQIPILFDNHTNHTIIQ